MKQETLKGLLPEGITSDDVVFVCIGSERSTGDALGPLVGTALEELGYEVMGTLEKPLHALNIGERIETLPLTKVHVAIDACLGNKEDIGSVIYHEGPLSPGKAVGKVINPIGDFSIKGMVNIGGHVPNMVLSSTSLFRVMNMAKVIVEEIKQNVPVMEAEYSEFY